MPRSFVEQFVDCNFVLLDALSVQRFKRNVIFSQMGIAYSLGMALVGASGETEREIRDFLSFSSSMSTADNLPLSNHLIKHYVRGIKSDPSIRWAYKMLFPAGSNISDEYRADVQVSQKITFDEYSLADKQLCDAINSWAAESTSHQIQKIVYLPLSKGDSALMMNVLYFKGTWKNGFPKEHTKPRPFFNFGYGHRMIDVETMHAKFEIHYLRREPLTMFRLEYDTGFEMIVAYHDDCGESISSKQACDCLHDFDAGKYLKVQASIFLPKFRIEQRLDLEQLLPQIKVNRMFTPRAEFEGISAHKKIHFSKFTSKACVAVDERGVQVDDIEPVWHTVSNEIPIEAVVRVDRPFVFFIRQSESQLILFSGYVHDLVEVPRAERELGAEVTIS